MWLLEVVKMFEEMGEWVLNVVILVVFICCFVVVVVIVVIRFNKLLFLFI